MVDTVYTLLLYYLICGINPDDLFIMSGGIPESIRKNIDHVYFPQFRHEDILDYSSVKKFIKRGVIIVKRVYGIIKLRIILFFKTRNYEVGVYGQGHLNFSFPLYEYENTYLIEDGLYNYANPEPPVYVNSKLKNFFGFYFDNFYAGFGTHDNIKKIYLTKNEVPEIVKQKTEVINLKELWDNKTDAEKNRILRIFNIEDLIKDIEDNPTLMLTQCFSEDGLIPLEEEIAIYTELISRQETQNVIIKTHPREKKDYREIFPDLTVIDKPFPLEILKCMGIKINKVITVSSTAALNFMDECEIELYDGKTSSDELDMMMSYLNKEIAKKQGYHEK